MRTPGPATRRFPTPLSACALGCLVAVCALACSLPPELKLSDPKAIVLDPNKPFDVCFEANIASGGAGRLAFHWDYNDGTTCDTACQAQSPLPPGSCKAESPPSPDKLHHYPENPKAYFRPVLTVMDGDLQVQAIRFGSVLVGNKRPRAAFKNPSVIGFVGIPYTIDGSASRDDDGAIASWHYDWGDETKPDVRRDPTPATHPYAAGEWSITLTVIDDNDTPSEAIAWPVRIVNDTTRPSVSITYPTDRLPVADGVTVVATATDNVQVTSVTFSDERGSFADVPGPGPAFRAQWNTTRVANGERRLTAVAFDEAGNASLPSSVTVVVQNP